MTVEQIAEQASAVLKNLPAKRVLLFILRDVRSGEIMARAHAVRGDR